MSRRSFFSYYGGKYATAKRYPAPKYDTIIEPFAGAAGYSTHYPDRQVILYDVDPVIAGLWEYLIHVSEGEIRGLPTCITDLRYMPLTQEQRWLIGFWINKGCSAPVNMPSSRYWCMARPNSHWGKTVREMLASNLQYIRHWKIFNKSYEQCDNTQATWFVDPPYVAQHGSYYRFNAVDFEHLGRWCRDRVGQTIVCESGGADWLPFVPHINAKGNAHQGVTRRTNEVIWTNDMVPV